MAFEKRNRGPRPGDTENFRPEAIARIRRAIVDYAYLAEREYGQNAITKTVGDRYGLNRRQRTALQRIAAAPREVSHRRNREAIAADVRNHYLAIDGFNLLITLESALAGGFVFRCVDGAIRDVASIAGTYKRVRQTEEAIRMVATSLQTTRPAGVEWLLDRPVSNSGRLAELIRRIGQELDYPWIVRPHRDPDAYLLETPNRVVVTSDSRVMDGAPAWYNLADQILRDIPGANLIDFSSKV